MLPWESSFRDGGLVEILFDLYKQTTVTGVDMVLAKVTRARSENDLTFEID